MIEITVNERGVRRALGALQNKSGVAIARAANRAVTTGKKVLKQETSRLYEVRQKDVEGAFKTLKKATYSSPYAVLVYSSHHKNLYSITWRGGRSVVNPSYPVRSASPYKGQADPEVYAAHVMKGRGNIPLNGHPKPFVQITKSGRLALFQRVSNTAHSAIRGVAAPALTQAIKNEKVLARFQREAGEMLQKRLAYEIDYLLKNQ